MKKSPSLLNDNGLYVDSSETPHRLLGYLIAHEGVVYAPGLKVGVIPLEDMDTHNRILALMEWDAMLKHGEGRLYLTLRDSKHVITDFLGLRSIAPLRVRKGTHNKGKTRYDVWFDLSGSLWHGLNIGDCQLLHVKKVKYRTLPPLTS